MLESPAGPDESLTDGNGVDGIGVAVVVAVVVVLAPVATGNNKNAAKASPTSDHAMLQRRLEGNRGKTQCFDDAVGTSPTGGGGLTPTLRPRKTSA